MKKDDIDAAMTELNEAIQVLETLRQRSQQLNEAEILTTTQLSKRRANIALGIRSKALMLYRALFSGWQWQTQCHDAHAVRLFLQNSHTLSISSSPGSSTANRRQLNFDLAFEGVKSSGAHMYHACGVEMTESQYMPASVQGVNFVMPDHTQRAVSVKLVDDICHVVKECSTKAEQLHLYLDDTGKLCYTNLDPASKTSRVTHLPRSKLVTLQDILSLPSMPLQSRVKISALVASSVIQLHATPWCSSLSRESIYFVKGDTGTVDLDNPFVVCRFDPSTRLPSSTVKVEAELELLNLGILILELWHNSTIQAFAASAQMQLDDTYSSLHNAARRWLAECRTNLLPDVHKAAVRCIGCRFDVIDADLEDMQMVLGVYEGVVKPLWMLACGSPNP
jgi:hypothetical protein